MRSRKLQERHGQTSPAQYCRRLLHDKLRSLQKCMRDHKAPSMDCHPFTKASNLLGVPL